MDTTPTRATTELENEDEQARPAVSAHLVLTFGKRTDRDSFNRRLIDALDREREEERRLGRASTIISQSAARWTTPEGPPLLQPRAGERVVWLSHTPRYVDTTEACHEAIEVLRSLTPRPRMVTIWAAIPQLHQIEKAFADTEFVLRIGRVSGSCYQRDDEPWIRSRLTYAGALAIKPLAKRLLLDRRAQAGPFHPVEIEIAA